MSCNNYGTASFKGVTFEVLGVSVSGGRRVVTHKYPMSNAHYNEDLGDKPQEWTVNGSFHGEDFRTKLWLAQIAWATKMNGLFFEPTQNRPYMLKLVDWDYKFSETKLNYVEFSLKLIESGNDPFTSGINDIVGVIDDFIDDASTAFTNVIGL